MATYEQVLGGQVNLGAVNWASAAPTAGSLGQQVLATIAALNPAVHADMLQITTAFHNAVALTGFRWLPATAGNSYTAGARLLDGTAATGECAYVANGLALLLGAAPPWGLGVAGITVQSYSGQNAVGFIADHGGGVPGAPANVLRPNGTPFAGYYLWANHKVVNVGGTLYDPCYDRTYNTLAGMASSQLQLVRAGIRLRDLGDYNPASIAGFLSLMGLKASDAFYNNAHTIDVYQAVGGASAGYYLDWGQDWKDWTWTRHIKTSWHGPYAANPLVR
jgi:hypothetical protein